MIDYDEEDPETTYYSDFYIKGNGEYKNSGRIHFSTDELFPESAFDEHGMLVDTRTQETGNEG